MTVEPALPRGRHGLSPSFVRTHQRERLLSSVCRACAADGYLSVTVADIVSQAHVSRRVFYSHYANKEECFLAAFETQLERLERRIAGACVGIADWQEWVAAGLAELLRSLAEQPDAAYALFVAPIAAGPKAIALRQRTLRRCARLLPLPQGAPSELAESVVGAVVQVIHVTVLAGEYDQLPSVYGDLLYCLLVPLVGHEQASATLERDAGTRA